MTQPRKTIVILCEDLQQEVFVRSFLQKRGFNRRWFSPNICPSGQQSGEQFVRDRYPAEVRAYRSKKNHLDIALVVVIDADTNEVENRFKQLEQALKDQSLPPRQPDEKIAVFVPKRNIETWIHYLMGESVDELTAYSKFSRQEGNCKPYVEELAVQCQQVGLTDDAPLSMRIACAELQKIL
ncbi:hypothetical protein V2H45_01965 [Tumidithrix elongata RA019]|uniref:DUF4276 family protein n=1 Tax=Tumidithrix elongata BACA0141 TaxID=2716417 RepID=A0AAW9PY90_9CYAN|nr:hypothetical protein [Tumidithrix elongata RA019]